MGRREAAKKDTYIPTTKTKVGLPKTTALEPTLKPSLTALLIYGRGQVVPQGFEDGFLERAERDMSWDLPGLRTGAEKNSWHYPLVLKLRCPNTVATDSYLNSS